MKKGKFNIRMMSYGETRLEEVDGYYIEICGIRCFTHKVRGNYWSVSNFATGMHMITSKSRKDAIAKCKNRLEEVNLTDVQKIIQSAITNYGIANE